ncbi:uncharacterized protein TNCV_1990521 [Trichonephila clavipes]|nr:uncharacterized protein TNCV_1990521 [Trichonephila clavipes]
MLARRVDNGRFQRHDGSGRPRVAADQEDRLIVRSAITVLDSSISNLRCTTRTRVPTMTIHKRLIGRVWRRPRQRADPAFTIARHTGTQQRVKYFGLICQQDNTKPHTTRAAMNCLRAYQTLPWPARYFSNRACLGYDGKATATTREC